MVSDFSRSRSAFGEPEAALPDVAREDLDAVAAVELAGGRARALDHARLDQRGDPQLGVVGEQPRDEALADEARESREEGETSHAAGSVIAVLRPEPSPPSRAASTATLGHSSMWEPIVTVRSSGRPKYSTGLAELREIATNSFLRQRAMPGLSVGTIVICDRK